MVDCVKAFGRLPEPEPKQRTDFPTPTPHAKHDRIGIPRCARESEAKGKEKDLEQL
jgi:hypothetical protein